ncbi:MAG: hypothetical protein WBW04_05355 [Nitrolancea sp.]
MRSFQRWFQRATNETSVALGQSHVRLDAIDTALFMTRSDDPTFEAIVFFHSPNAEGGRIRAKYRGSEAERIREFLRGMARY